MPTTLPSLPLELLEEIARILDLDSQLSLSCVSKLFHLLTIKSIYRVIDLDSPALLVACCRTLASSRIAAAAVRRFSITYMPATPYSTHYFPAFYTLIQSALHHMSHLQELKLLVPDPNYTPRILLDARTRFHSLRHFECYLPLEKGLILFLNRHPSIMYLQIAPFSGTTTGTGTSVVLPPVKLPKLQYFIGNSDCVPTLLSSSSSSPTTTSSSPPLRAAFLYWDQSADDDNDILPLPPQPPPPSSTTATPTTHPDPDPILSLSHSPAASTLNLLSCRRKGWNLDLIRLISVCLPGVWSLIVTNLLGVDERMSETYISTLTTLLPSFPFLQRLHIHCVDSWKLSTIRCSFEDGYRTVTRWGGVCGSLVECVVPHSDGIPWIRRHGIWVPDPYDPEGVRWVYGVLYGGSDDDDDEGEGDGSGSENEDSDTESSTSTSTTTSTTTTRRRRRVGKTKEWRALKGAFERRLRAVGMRERGREGGSRRGSREEEEERCRILREVILGERL